MFGTLGTPELIFIFLMALLLFGPKKLPEIGRTVGKALTEFRRASNELKSTFEREMKTLEQEGESFKEATSQYQYDTYNYDYSAYEGSSENSYGTENYDSTTASESTASASAPEGAELTAVAAPEGTVARGAEVNSDSHAAAAETGEQPPQPAPVPTTSEKNA